MESVHVCAQSLAVICGNVALVFSSGTLLAESAQSLREHAFRCTATPDDKMNVEHIHMQRISLDNK